MIEKTHEAKVYIANDGAKFNDMETCLRHDEITEKIDCLEECLKSAIRNDNAYGFAPFNGDEHTEQHDYYWVKIKSKEEIEQWNKALVGEYSSFTLSNSQIGKWICLEREYGGDVVCITSLDASIEYAKKVLKLFGLDMQVMPATKFDTEDILRAQKRLGKDFDDTLRIVMEYQDDAKGDIDDVIDIYENEIKEEE